MGEPLSPDALRTQFTEARTHYDWEPEPLEEETIRRLHELLALGPTSANCQPGRFIFCATKEARDRLAACASEANAPKIRQAPVTVIIGMDPDFPETLSTLFPHTDAASWFRGKPDLIRETAFRNSSLQGAWLIMAARALGLDTGPMSGFDKAAVDAAFWSGARIETNFICSLGYGTGKKLFPRLPRPAFEDVCQLI